MIVYGKSLVIQCSRQGKPLGKLNSQAHGLLAASRRDPDPSSVDHQEEIGAAYDQGYKKGQADTREQLQAEIDEVRKKGRHEALTQYDLGYQKGKKEQQGFHLRS